MPDPIRLWYTFGNHMHWVDMQWLWGYHVLPGSTFDMLRFCEETGAKGNVNFDGIGYEKMAAEAPEALTALREAVSAGQIEPVGCSYGQPYGLFHGGESNIRQRIYGARTVMRLLGVRPRTFWEEEFDFFPQLPQMLRGCGFENAALYFQWTWHTPEVPFESSPVIWWEGIDGSRLLTATRNRLNLHQWPEDFQLLLDELAESGPREVLRKIAAPERGVDPSPQAIARWEGEGGAPEEHSEGLDPLVLQWLELMPSPDWMCRSELMIPKLKGLLDDPRFEVVFGTLGEYLDQAKDRDVPVRRYGMHEVWHGLSLGKNGDYLRRESRAAESLLLAAESSAAALSLFGRPYPHWDVYPTWELEEGWRKLLMAQHHDNDECEGLCGHVGEIHYETASRHAISVAETNDRFWNQFDPPMFDHRHGWAPMRVKKGPDWENQGDHIILTTPDFDARLSSSSPALLQLGGQMFDPPLSLLPGENTWTIDVTRGRVRYESANLQVDVERFDGTSGIQITVQGVMRCIAPGFGGAVYWDIPTPDLKQLKADTAYAVDIVRAEGKWPRKYPSGDWMTSPQWFESVSRPFVAQGLVNLDFGDRQLLILQDRTRQWFQTEDGIRCVLNLRDPWDEDQGREDADCRFRLVPHQGMTNAEMWRLAQRHRRYSLESVPAPVGQEKVPPRFAAARSEPPSVELTAFYREAEDFAGRGLDTYAGRGMGYPFILRLVEFEGQPAEAIVRIAGTVARAFRTNLMGEIETELAVEVKEDLAEWESLFADEFEGDVLPNLHGKYSLVRLPMRGREIATLYVDIIEGRKQPRDLDAHREIWATVHRT